MIPAALIIQLVATYSQHEVIGFQLEIIDFNRNHFRVHFL
jgi:hypothetical protein